MDKTFQQKLQKIVTFKKEAKINIKTLNADFKDALLKPTRDRLKVGWVASNGKYLRWNMQQFLRWVEQTKVYKLQFVKNYQKSILKHIFHIKFTQLQYINLLGNWIQNIEPIIYMDTPVLRELNIKNNEIVEMKALRKMVSRKFKILRINTHKNIANLSELNNYNRHSSMIGRELLKNHVDTIFSMRIKRLLKMRQIFYPMQKQSNKNDSSDSDSE